MKVRWVRGELFPAYTLSPVESRSFRCSLRKRVIIPSTAAPGAEKIIKISWLSWKIYRFVEILFVELQDRLWEVEEIREHDE